MTDILSKVKLEYKIFEDRKKQLSNSLRREFPQIFKHLFDKSKQITTVSWFQFTSYWEDISHFAVGINYLKINDVIEEDSEIRLVPEEYTIIEEFKTLLKSIPEDLYKDLFGDHCEVVIFKNGNLEINEHEEHD